MHIASLGGQQRVKPTIWRAIIAFKAVANPLPQQESSHPQRRMTTTHGRPHAESPPSGRVGNRDETEDAAHYGGRDVPAQRTPMAAMVVLTIVTVGGRQYDLMAHQRSKNSWIACGNFKVSLWKERAAARQRLRMIGGKRLAGSEHLKGGSRLVASTCGTLHSAPRSRSASAGSCRRSQSKQCDRRERGR